MSEPVIICGSENKIDPSPYVLVWFHKKEGGYLITKDNNHE